MEELPPSCIYLDHHATTPMDERVFNAMKPFFLSQFGNPASQTHRYGWQAQEEVHNCRKQIAETIGAKSHEIIFTSGATEATNLALKGLSDFAKSNGKTHLIASSIEHSATLDVFQVLKEQGFDISLIGPNGKGIIEPEAILRAIRPSTFLVSLFAVNNEIGTINPIHEIAPLLRERGILFHCDGVQALGRVPLDVSQGIHLMSLSGHKVYGPKGVGVLYAQAELKKSLKPQIHGGGQEEGLRSGTLNVSGIVGMAEACKLLQKDFSLENKRLAELRDRLWERLSILDNACVNGCLTHRVSGNLNVSFDGVDGEELLIMVCQRVAVSSGSACSGSGGNSHVLKELGVSSERRHATLRFGLGRFNTLKEIDTAADVIISSVNRLRTNRITLGRNPWDS